MVEMIVFLTIGYFVGMASAITQIVRLEKKYNEKFEEIMKNK